MLRISGKDIRPGYINIGSGEWGQDFYVFHAVDESGVVFYTITLYDQYSVGEEVETSECWRAYRSLA